MSGLLDYYIVAGYTTPESADPPDSGDYFIRAEESIYVEAGYWDGGYVLRSLSGISDVNISSGLSASAVAPQIEATANNISISAGVSVAGSSKRTFAATIDASVLSSSSATSIKSGEITISGVLNASVTANARLTSSIFLDSTVVQSSSANAVFDNTVELLQVTRDRTWAESGTWATVFPEPWAPRMRTSGFAYRIFSGQLLASAALSGSSNNILPGVVTPISSTVTLTAAGGNVVDGVVSPIGSTASLSARGDTELIGTANNIEINTAVSAEGISVQLAYATLDVEGALLSASGRIRPFVETAPIITTMTVNCARIRPGVVETAIAVESSTQGNSTTIASLTAGVNSILSTLGNYRVLDTSTINSEVTLSTLGGKRVGMAFNEYLINAGSLNSLSYRLRRDPYFTIVAQPELRNTTNPQETRKIASKTENRLNTTTAETRVIRNLPETRQYYIDRGTLSGALEKERT
jgi:hypothetical protein